MTCGVCHGSGKLTAPRRTDTGYENDLVKCEACAGAGHYPDPDETVRYYAGGMWHEGSWDDVQMALLIFGEVRMQGALVCEQPGYSCTITMPEDD